MMISGQLALPAADDPRQLVDAAGVVRLEHHCVEPLQTFRVTMTGVAAAHTDPTAPLRRGTGTPVDVAFDLTWETSAVPYAWRQATRYEIPCRVAGTVRIGEQELPFAGPGQRDHSWGARDWWAVDWMWNALHLDDGTHIHQVGVPQMPGTGVGYIQRSGEVTEISGLEMTTVDGADGLPERVTLISGGLTIEVDPLAWGVLRLQAPDGRVTHFPRAMARVTADDGRTGSGWIEWNRVQRGG